MAASTGESNSLYWVLTTSVVARHSAVVASLRSSASRLTSFRFLMISAAAPASPRSRKGFSVAMRLEAANALETVIWSSRKESKDLTSTSGSGFGLGMYGAPIGGSGRLVNRLLELVGEGARKLLDGPQYLGHRSGGRYDPTARRLVEEATYFGDRH